MPIGCGAETVAVSCGRSTSITLTVDLRAKRLAQNESLFREVNERVEEIASGFADRNEEDRLIGFVCECGRGDCTKSIDLTRAEYEFVRSNPLRFLVLAGHEDDSVERVVERTERFLVVVKLGEGARVAAEQDPRS
jgi:hypothetical protein